METMWAVSRFHSISGFCTGTCSAVRADPDALGGMPFGVSSGVVFRRDSAEGLFSLWTFFSVRSTRRTLPIIAEIH
jgi:hypothetical protein